MVYEEYFTSYANKDNTRDADWNIRRWHSPPLLPQDTMKQSIPVVSALPGQGAYIAWEDGRENGTSIYLQHLRLQWQPFVAKFDVKLSDFGFSGSESRSKPNL